MPAAHKMLRARREEIFLLLGISEEQRRHHGRWDMRRFSVVRVSTLGCILIVLTAQAGCAQTTKTLNETSAKRMVIDQMKTKGDVFLVQLDSVVDEIHSPTREDYIAGSYAEASPKAAVQRLLKSGYLNQSREDLKLINITGTYKTEGNVCGKEVYTFALSMQPSSPVVSGQYTYNHLYQDGQQGMKIDGPVTGEVKPDGSVTLFYGPMNARSDYTIKADGTSIILDGPKFFSCTKVVATGSGPGGFITVPKYSYAYADKLKALLDASGKLKAGTIKVDDVHNLLLETDTIATARCAIHIDLNAAGAAVLGKAILPDQREVTFRKQPDGTWVLPAN
jgi:hypothetical protein